MAPIRSRVRPRSAVPWVVLAMSLAFTFGFAAWAEWTNRAKERSRFTNLVESYYDAIRGRLDTYLNVLLGAAGLFAADPDVQGDELAAWVSRIDLGRRYPGIQGIGFSVHAPLAAGDQIRRAMQAEGFAEFHFWPRPADEELDAILYLYPLDRRNRAAIGYDMASEPTRRTAMWEARDRGAPAASGKVILVQEIDRRRQPGFLIYLPVYDSPSVPATVAERRSRLRGYVYAPFRAEDLLRGIFRNISDPRLDFEIYDGRDPAPSAILFRSTALDPRYRAAHERTMQLEVAGRIWTLRFWSNEAFDATSGDTEVWIVLVCGLLASAALFWMTTVQARARGEAERLFEEAESQRHAAERASRAKDEFLATLSHELRTPMTSILGWSSLLSEGALDGEDQTHAARAIYQSSRIQSQLIEDLLDLSRIHSGKLAVEPQPVDLREVARSAVESVRMTGEEKGLTIELDLPAELPRVWADPKRLHQILWNLLSNAIKFTDPPGTITVRAFEERGAAGISVTDTGVGIEPDFLPRLFQRFQQADSTTTRPHSGLGIGLALVRHLVELHGGQVEASSEGKGRGSRFTVRLPVTSAWERVLLGAEAAAASLEPQPQLDGLRILLVEDEPGVRQYLAAVLGQAGATVTEAATAKLALQAFHAQPFDLLVSDLALPGEDGLSLIRRIRAMDDPSKATLPALAVTAHVRNEDLERTTHAGFDAVLQKPVERRTLLFAIIRLVEASKRAGSRQGAEP